jgi:hypothetical protein
MRATLTAFPRMGTAPDSHPRKGTMQDAPTTRRLTSVTGALLAAALIFVAPTVGSAHASSARENAAAHGRGAANGAHGGGAHANAPANRTAPRAGRRSAASHPDHPEASDPPAAQGRATRGRRRGGARPGHRPSGGGRGGVARVQSHRSTGGRTVTASGTAGGPTAGSGCTAHRDPRDPGSCQEKGGGNAGDIDPYRGPDAPGNDPARGNDCDEGGGNNRGSYPRRTNPNNPGDSDVDGDRGRGNNRCGTSGGEPGGNGPGGSGPGGGGPGRGPVDPGAQAAAAVLGLTLIGSAEYAEGGSDPGILGLESASTDPARSGEERSAPAQVLRALGQGRLPFTGLGLGWIALGGVLLGGLGLGLRRLPSIA